MNVPHLDKEFYRKLFTRSSFDNINVSERCESSHEAYHEELSIEDQIRLLKPIIEKPCYISSIIDAVFYIAYEMGVQSIVDKSLEKVK